MLVAALAAPSLAAAQTSAPPAAPDVLRELLVEVRGLRAAMERAATVGARIQLLVARVQMQEQRIAELSRRAITVREEIGKLDAQIAQHNAMIKQFERSVSSGRGNADEQREFEGMIEVHKQQMAITEKRRQELVSEEALLAQQIAADQGRWSDVNNQLDDLERSLTPRKP
jgi:predicted  nucleic acid-binding Zn-ribbon protein